MRSYSRVALTVAVLGSVVSASAAPAPGAVGTIGRKGSVLKVADAFAYEAKSFMGDEPVIRVRFSAKALDHAALQGALDFERELNTQQDGSESVELELTPSGAWMGGGTYTLGRASCGWCQNGAQSDTAKFVVEGGVLKGTLKAKATDVEEGDGVDADLVVNLPVARPEGVTTLPASGAEPGQAFLACATAMKGKDEAAIITACFAPDHRWLADQNLDYFNGDEFAVHAGQWFQALTLQDVTITGGRMKGENAEVLVKGRIVRRYGQDQPEEIEPYKGTVFLRRYATGWRIAGQQLESDYQ